MRRNLAAYLKVPSDLKLGLHTSSRAESTLFTVFAAQLGINASAKSALSGQCVRAGGIIHGSFLIRGCFQTPLLTTFVRPLVSVRHLLLKSSLPCKTGRHYLH
uniref:Uncharacterized protein n=1 Tax=Schistocephalus solidus TaxID=70667 RepID=A0A0V0J9S0_SCHSO